MLTYAHALLQERVAKIPDDALRRSFLENVAEHQEIVSEYARVAGEFEESSDDTGDD